VRNFAIAALLAGTTACSNPTGASSDGASVYESVCSSCHGLTGKPPEQMVAQLNVRDLSSPEMRAKITPELVEHQVRTGSQNKLMPSFQGAISDAQIKAVSAYVASPEFLKRGQK
jgi:mono/diheme cytochrome c family protein